jgi:hypothetical protein
VSYERERPVLLTRSEGDQEIGCPKMVMQEVWMCLRIEGAAGGRKLGVGRSR